MVCRAGVVYSSVETALVAGVAPTVLADSATFGFDTRHCTVVRSPPPPPAAAQRPRNGRVTAVRVLCQVAAYFFFSVAAFLLCHTLSSVVVDYQIAAALSPPSRSPVRTTPPPRHTTRTRSRSAEGPRPPPVLLSCRPFALRL